jgi:ABC-type transport system involved in multi-copper enzyme maturation permease subunit
LSSIAANVVVVIIILIIVVVIILVIIVIIIVLVIVVVVLVVVIVVVVIAVGVIIIIVIVVVVVVVIVIVVLVIVIVVVILVIIFVIIIAIAVMRPSTLSLPAAFDTICHPSPPLPPLPLPPGHHRLHCHHRGQTCCHPLPKKEATAAAPPAYQWQHQLENVYKSRQLDLFNLSTVSREFSNYQVVSLKKLYLFAIYILVDASLYVFGRWLSKVGMA